MLLGVAHQAILKQSHLLLATHCLCKRYPHRIRSRLLQGCCTVHEWVCQHVMCFGSDHRKGLAARLRRMCWLQAVMQECNMVFEELLGLRSMYWRLARTWLDCCHHPGEPSL